MNIKQLIKRLILAGAVLTIFVATICYLLVWGSLPRLAGELMLADLNAPVIVQRDALGVPTIRGSNRLDVARATGFLHAQERFFQMDLTRRDAA